MHVNYYQKSKIKSSKILLKVNDKVLLLDYLAHFISNSDTKRVQGFGTVGLAHNTIRTYKSLYRIIKVYEYENTEKLNIKITCSIANCWIESYHPSRPLK